MPVRLTLATAILLLVVPARADMPGLSAPRTLRTGIELPTAGRTAEPALADDAEEPNGVSAISLLWENDGQYFRFVNDSDRWYTNGVKLDVSLRRPWPAFTTRLIPFGGRYDEDARDAGGLVLTQQIFTPERIEDSGPIPDGHPYAGYLYLGAYVQRSDEHNFDHLELDLGVVGSWSGGESAQKFVHAVLPNQIKPSGWDNQLANEPTVQLTYEHRWRTPRASLAELELDAIGGLGAQLGNVYINAHANLTARVGYNLPDDFGPPSINTFRDATGTWRDDFGAYGFVRLSGYLVGRDMFLDGNTFANSLSVDSEPLVGTIQAGVALRYHWFETGWSTTWETKRFEGQRDGHVYAAWHVAARLTY
jgi:hypothetical protein